MPYPLTVQMQIEAEKQANPDLISVAEASMIVHRSAANVYELVQTGRIEGKLVGRAWLVSKFSAQAFAARANDRCLQCGATAGSGRGRKILKAEVVAEYAEEMAVLRERAERVMGAAIGIVRSMQDDGRMSSEEAEQAIDDILSLWDGGASTAGGTA